MLLHDDACLWVHVFHQANNIEDEVKIIPLGVACTRAMMCIVQTNKGRAFADSTFIYFIPPFCVIAATNPRDDVTSMEV